MILTIILVIISAAAYSIQNTIQFHFWRSVFKNLDPQFWCPSLSWINKYKSKDNLQPKFFGSTTFLVFLTDAFHLFQFISINSMVLSIAINIESYPWYLNFIGLRLIFGFVWWALFEHLLIKK